MVKTFHMHDRDLRRHRRGGRADRLERAHDVLAASNGSADSHPSAGEGARLPLHARVPTGGRRAIVGSHATVRAGLEAVAEEYGTEELMLLTITYDHEARRRSYELIAEEFGLGDSRS